MFSADALRWGIPTLPAAPLPPHAPPTTLLSHPTCPTSLPPAFHTPTPPCTPPHGKKKGPCLSLCGWALGRRSCLLFLCLPCSLSWAWPASYLWPLAAASSLLLPAALPLCLTLPKKKKDLRCLPQPPPPLRLPRGGGGRNGLGQATGRGCHRHARGSRRGQGHAGWIGVAWIWRGRILRRKDTLCRHRYPYRTPPLPNTAGVLASCGRVQTQQLTLDHSATIAAHGLRGAAITVCGSWRANTALLPCLYRHRSSLAGAGWRMTSLRHWCLAITGTPPRVVLIHHAAASPTTQYRHRFSLSTLVTKLPSGIGKN